jgi:hypothetical protein
MWKTALALGTLAFGLAGCAGFNTVESDVSTYSKWAPARAVGTYAFERLPSQEARARDQERLEGIARPALEAAGFKPATDPKAADVSVQIGARASRAERSPYDDPLWWRGGLYYSRFGRHSFYGPQVIYHFDSPRYEREVVMLIRDRTSGEPLYEARATNDGNTPGGEDLLGAMFKAAMKDFPHTGVNPRRVSVPLP